MATLVSPERPVIEGEVEQAQHTAESTEPQQSRQIRALRRRQRLAAAHVWAARVVLAGIAVQVFFAGIGVFGVGGFLPHAIFGAILILSSFSVPILALASRAERSLMLRSWLLAGLMILQGLLIDVGRTVHLVAALHPVNAMLLVLVAYTLARRSGKSS